MKIKLVEDRRKVWRKWSVRLNSIGLFITSLYLIPPDTALWLVNSMPLNVQRMLPPYLLTILQVCAFSGAIIAAYVKQRSLEKPDAKPE